MKRKIKLSFADLERELSPLCEPETYKVLGGNGLPPPTGNCFGAALDAYFAGWGQGPGSSGAQDYLANIYGSSNIYGGVDPSNAQTYASCYSEWYGVEAVLGSGSGVASSLASQNASNASFTGIAMFDYNGTSHAVNGREIKYENGEYYLYYDDNSDTSQGSGKVKLADTILMEFIHMTTGVTTMSTNPTTTEAYSTDPEGY